MKVRGSCVWGRIERSGLFRSRWCETKRVLSEGSSHDSPEFGCLIFSHQHFYSSSNLLGSFSNAALKMFCLWGTCCQRCRLLPFFHPQVSRKDMAFHGRRIQFHLILKRPFSVRSQRIRMFKKGRFEECAHPGLYPLYLLYYTPVAFLQITLLIGKPAHNSLNGEISSFQDCKFVPLTNHTVLTVLIFEETERQRKLA